MELLFKSTASGELGEYKTAKKFTKAAYNIIGNILWSPDSGTGSRSRDSQTSEGSSIDIQEETSSLDKLRKKIMVRDENVRENIGLSKEISRLISSDDENSDTEQNIDSQNLFQNTEIRKNASRTTFFNRTPEKKSPAASPRVQPPAASPAKSLLRTPTEKFKKKPTQGLKWPNPYPLKDFNESPRRRVSFNSIPKVKVYDPYQTDSQSTLSDIEVISGKF